MRLTAPLMLFFLGVLALAQAQPITREESGKPVVYIDSSDTSPAMIREARKAYADKFQVTEPEPNAGFAPGGVKGTRPLITTHRRNAEYLTSCSEQHRLVALWFCPLLQQRIALIFPDLRVDVVNPRLSNHSIDRTVQQY